MATWNSGWQLLPKNSESPTEADDNMRGIKGAIERRMRNEHDTYNDATGGAEALDWRHKEGSARCWYESAEPANSPSAGALAAGHLWWDSDDDELYCYDGDSFQPLNAATADLTTTTEAVDEVNGTTMKMKVIEIGNWDMDATASVAVAHGLGDLTIRSAEAWVRTDAGGTYYNLSLQNDGTLDGGITAFTDANITLTRLTGGYFDSISFDTAALNRGYVTIWYEA